MKKWIILSAAALICAIAAGVWYFLIIKDKREVMALVGNVAELVSKKSENLPHAGIFKHAKVDELFDEKVTFKIAKPDVDLTLSREELKGRVAILLRLIDYMQVDTENISVEIAGDQAVFTFDALVSGRAKSKKDDFSDVYRCSGSAVKRDGKWVMNSLTAEPVIQ